MTTLAPPGASEIERRLDAAAAVCLGAVPAALPQTAWDVDQIPAAWLPVLAWALSLDLWDPVWSARQKRAVIRQAVALHREHGTVAAIRRVLEAIGAIYDYVEPPEAPFTATITIHNTATLLLDELTEVRAQLERVKRASVHLTLQVHEGFCVPLAVAGGLTAVVVAPGLRVA